MTEFIGNDQAYLKWLSQHKEAYILNTRKIFDGYCKVHRATCNHISVPKKAKPGEFTQNRYIKVGASSIEDLQQWLGKKDQDLDIYHHLCPCTSRGPGKN